MKIQNGLLFSLTNGSSLNLNANAFGVFGSSTDTLIVRNSLCGGGMACGQLVNSANNPFLSQDGSALKVAGVSQNVVLPNNFNVFAVQNPNAPPPTVIVETNDAGFSAALFKVDATSTLTINGTTVKK